MLFSQLTSLDGLRRSPTRNDWTMTATAITRRSDILVRGLAFSNLFSKISRLLHWYLHFGSLRRSSRCQAW